jgi:hypothetical protein
MELHNVQQEGEVYSAEARVQLSLSSYLRIVLIMAGAWALVDVIVGMFTMRGIDGESPEIMLSLFAIGTYAGFGFVKALFCGLVSYPLYRWWCQRHRGQRMTGKFAVIVKS